MGNGAINCCEASSAMLDELSMNSPRNMKSPSKASIINEVSSKHIHIRADSEINPLCPVPELHIKVVNSGPIAKDTRFCITKQGLSGSKRQCKDGKVYFGCKRKEKGIRANDVVIPIHDKELEEHHRGRHFMISYQSHKYFIKDLGKGFGVYARVDSPLLLKENMIINIGASYLAFSQVESNKKQLINVKIMGEERSSICFESSNFLEKPIHIGRCITCDLRLDDNLLSKVHSTLYHSPSGWYLIDGDQEKRSTNGTWLYLTEDLEMYSGMIFKCNQSVFQVLSLSEEHLT